MPRPTSDLRNPVCLEMRSLKGHALTNWNQFPGADINTRTAFQYINSNNNNHPQDIGSVDSSDTFASCNTHPFLSQGDLTSDVVDPTCALMPSDSNLYVNPLDKSTDNSPVQQTVSGFGRGTATGVKKSASGDTALRSLGTSPLDEPFRGFGGIDRGSRGSLNDSPLPKHRKTRFQQSAKQRTRFSEAGPERGTRFESQESLEGKKGRRGFMAGKSLSSATRIINQHLFGLQTLGGSRAGKNGSKSSSVDSIDASPPEQHRRSKSILKKSDSSGHRNGRVEDPESERLISDNMSGHGIDPQTGSSSDFSPNKRLAATMSPPVRHRPVSRNVKSLPLKYQEDNKTRALKSPLFLLDDIFSDKKGKEGRMVNYKDGSEINVINVSEVPLYICPPPPPMEDHSPTEETRLLLHQTPVPQHKQTPNSTPKGANQIS